MRTAVRYAVMVVLAIQAVGCSSTGEGLRVAQDAGIGLDTVPEELDMGVQGLRYLALGDSYTIGERVEAPERWPNQLAARLDADGVPVASTEIIARTGWTTANLDAGIDAAAPEGPYGLVSLLIGVNNQYQGRDAEQYRQELVRLLERSIALAGGEARRVFVVSIPDWGVTPFAADRDRAAVSAEIDAFNAICREETLRLGLVHVDITPISRQPDPERRLVAPDGLHPSGEQYRQWVELILPVAKAAATP